MKKTKYLFPAVMQCTAAAGALSTIGFFLSNHFYPRSWLVSAVITSGTIFYHFSMRLLVGMIVPKVFGSVNPAHRWFQPKPFEERLFRFLKIKKWKKYVPTYAPDTFSLDHPLAEISETMCISELVHTFIVLFSFLPLFLAIPFGEFLVFLSTSFISAAVDCVFILLQRYNRPRILRLLAKKEAQSP